MTKNGDTPLQEETPWLEYLAATLGALFTAFTLGVIAWNGLAGDDSPPDLSVQVVGVAPRSGGFAIDIKVVNTGARTASDVTIEARSGEDDGQAQFDYVPGGGSERNGTIVLGMDPGPDGPELRVLGYREP